MVLRGSRHDAPSGQPRGGIFASALSHGPLQRVWVCLLVVPSSAKFCVSSLVLFRVCSASKVVTPSTGVHPPASPCFPTIRPQPFAPDMLWCPFSPEVILVFNHICLAPSQQAQRENETAQVKRGEGHGAVACKLGEREVLRACTYKWSPSSGSSSVATVVLTPQVHSEP